MIAVNFLLLSVWAAAGEYAGNHLLHYSYTGVSDPVPGLPVFSIAQFLDDKMTTKYNSDVEKTQPGVPWLDTGDLEEWAHLLYEHTRWWQMAFKHNVKTAMSRFNQSGGFHVIQLMYGCELRSDNSSRLFYRYGYDGRDFIRLETDRWVFEPCVYEAQISTQRWNSMEDGAGQRWRHILEVRCVDLLRKYFDHGRVEMERKVAPEVKILTRESRGVRSLHCWVYGFYLRAVEVRWVKDGQDTVYSDEIAPLLPNPDGTYQAVITVKVPAEDESSYSCHIDHSSLAEGRIVPWEHNMKRHRKLLIPSFVAFVVIMVLVLWKNLSVPATPAHEEAGVCQYTPSTPLNQENLQPRPEDAAGTVHPS